MSITLEQYRIKVGVASAKMNRVFDKYITKQLNKYVFEDNELITLVFSILINVIIQSLLLIQTILEDHNSSIDFEKSIDYIAVETKKQISTAKRTKALDS